MYLSGPSNDAGSYLKLADLKADSAMDLTDRNGVALTDATLSAWLTEHSGFIDAMIGTSYLPQEQKLRIYGSGSNHLWLGRHPIIYVKQAKIVLPNSVGFDIPIQSLLVHHQDGELQNMTPLTFQGLGITTMFPAGIPIDVTVAWGIGYAVPPPTFALTAAGNSTAPLPPGSYDVAVSSITYSGESLPSAIQTINLPAGGSILCTVTNAPGAMRYYAYLAPHSSPVVFQAELQAMAIGAGVESVILDASIPSSPIAFDSTGARAVPQTVDSSAAPFFGKYAALRRATKMLVQQSVWEHKNPSNQGIASMQSGPKKTMFKDNLHSTFAQNLDSVLSALKYQGIA